MQSRLLILTASVIPLLAIFTLPLFGVNAGITLTLLHVAVFTIHLIWTRSHSKPAQEERAEPAFDNRLTHTLSPFRVGFAICATFGMIYIGCAIIMLTVSREAGIRFYNNLTHGVDWSPILAWDVPIWHVPLGLIQVGILGWLIGATAAAAFNITTMQARRS